MTLEDAYLAATTPEEKAAVLDEMETDLLRRFVRVLEKFEKKEGFEFINYQAPALLLALGKLVDALIEQIVASWVPAQEVVH